MLSTLMKVRLAKPSREEKAEVIASLLSCSTPTPTTTKDITSKLQDWMRMHISIHLFAVIICNLHCIYVHVYTHYPLLLSNTTHM